MTFLAWPPSQGNELDSFVVERESFNLFFEIRRDRISARRLPLIWIGVTVSSTRHASSGVGQAEVVMRSAPP